MPLARTIPCQPMALREITVGLISTLFLKAITFQEITKKGLENIGKAIEIMAEAEGLQAHKNAVTIRLGNTDKDEDKHEEI